MVTSGWKSLTSLTFLFFVRYGKDNNRRLPGKGEQSFHAYSHGDQVYNLVKLREKSKKR